MPFVAPGDGAEGSGSHQALTPQDDHVDSYVLEHGQEAQESAVDVEAAEENVALPLSTSQSRQSRNAYEPIRQGDDVRLHELAREMSSYNTNQEADLSRVDTIAGLEWHNAVLDPQSDQFDLYKWIRKTLSVAHEEDLKITKAGLVFDKINVSGKGAAVNVQGTVGSMFTAPLRAGAIFQSRPHKDILRDFSGLLRSGEMLIVLGRPGSGCSTLLKTLTGEMHGLHVDKDSKLHYGGIPQKQMMQEFRGEVIYNQEVDKHFPHLTVGETLEHAAALRTPSTRLMGATREQHFKLMTKVVMTVYGLSHTYNTKVGDDFVRGVSGGERKRVSIAEMALAGTSIAAWDNSTRGLDAATALAFTKSLRQTANLIGNSHAVAIYQASQAIYDLFDKAIVLYEGREIFFGPANQAKDFFIRMGWHCPSRQTTGDFLTSVTNPVERTARDGFEKKVPRTPDEFEAYWKDSPEYKLLQEEIASYEEEYPVNNEQQLSEMREQKRQQQVKHARQKSPYIVSVPMQVKLNIKRAWQRIWNDKTGTLTPVIGMVIISLIIGSVFYGTPNATIGFQSKGAALFFAVLINALSSISEINSLYAQRPIVEKHKSYAFYHPATEAAAGMVLDIPIKFVQAVVFNLILYFMVGLRREPSQFFLFFLIAFVTTFTMSAIFRTLAATTKTVSQAMALSGVIVLALVIYTGFVVPTAYMKPWFGWIRWLNPVYYAFEILIANEFHGREFTCSSFIPGYAGVVGGQFGDSFICSQVGSVAGERTVSGDAYIQAAYNYSYSHVWRNFGILLGFLIFFLALYFVSVELNSSTSSTAEVLVFRRGHVPKYLQDKDGSTSDEESGEKNHEVSATEGDESVDAKDLLPPQKDIFAWKDVDYDIEIKGEPRRLLDHVSGWTKPGTLTALMGTSGAGKTTLLDVLAQRTTMGVVSGSMLVNGAPLDSSFPRKTGYVQQQDLHLETSTVREALQFSAMLRQPKSVSKREKYDYVENVIKMLNMEDFAEAAVGVPGEGLNVEQRKLLTIGVELAAKPKLLLFLDEPTSGLDSQSSWAICSLLRKLADAGQAIVCTIHQPSAILFQQFDRLLFLRKGGQTVYFGDIGKDSRTLLEYFESNGARKCDEDENPAEYMLEICKEEKWVNVWKGSQEAKDVRSELDHLNQKAEGEAGGDEVQENHQEFAMPFSAQLYAVTYRVFQQYWRMPTYIVSKLALSAIAGLFIGFSFFQANSTQQGMQNVVYSLFMLTTIFSTLVQQIQPLFITQRALYEVRERPSKAYSWKAFLIANVVVEIPYQTLAGILIWCTFYYPVVGIQSSERQALVLLFAIALLIYASTFAHMTIAAMPDAQTAGAIVTLLFSMTLIFNGVMQSPTALPGFWIFMYRVSPLTYWTGGIASSMLHDRQIICSSTELSVFNPPAGLTCGQYLAPYLQLAPGTLQNPNATSNCGYCQLSNGDQFLAGAGINWDDRWRNFGLMWAYVAFNIGVAVFTYWFFRVRQSKGKSGKSGKGKKKQEQQQQQAKGEGAVTQTSVEESEEAHSSDNEEVEKPAQNRLARTVSEMGAEYLKRNQRTASMNPGNATVY